MNVIGYVITNAILVIISALVGAYIYRRGTINESVFKIPDSEPEKDPVVDWDEI